MITQIVVDLSDVFPVCAVSLACDGDAAHIVELFLAEPVGREQYAAASVTDDLDDDRIVIACPVRICGMLVQWRKFGAENKSGLKKRFIPNSARFFLS